MLEGKVVVLGVCGGIAAYKMADLASRLTKNGCETHVIMTRNATELIQPLTFETLTKNKCCVSTFERVDNWEVEHVELAKKADLMVIAPATANTIAKMAHGIADDMLTTTVLAATCPKLVYPSMNTRMYENPITQDNLQKLRSYGFFVEEPDSGMLACGDSGKGRLPETEQIYERICQQICCTQDMKGLRVLVTAGPTQEPIDPVRYITNHSTGKMGYAIAKAARMRGANVTLVSGPVSLPRPAGVTVVPVVTAQDMFRAVTNISNEYDIIIKTAAVADYKPKSAANHKLKKGEMDSQLELTRTKDILAELGARKRHGQFLCGFSMETQDLIENSAQKLEKKNLDMIVANSISDPGAGFGVDTNIVTLITKGQITPLKKMSKQALAQVLLDQILAHRG